jgi:hypothetical protein
LKKSPEKVVPSDEPMVPPAERRIIRCLTAPNIVVEPRNPDNAPTPYTDEDHVWFEDRRMVASLCDE